ncbi:MAG: glycosyltransferase [Planctomycetota bacterium]
MITLILFPIVFIATLSVLSWLYILLHPAKPWDFQPVGDDAPLPPLPEGVTFPRVAIIVPARNEAESLPNTLPALLRQDYPGEYSVYVIDDRSSDGTAELAREIAKRESAEMRLTVIQGSPLPEGWMGKVWALTQGTKVAAETGAEFFLLTDADILHAPGSLRRLVSENITMKLGMNSRMARLRCESLAERLLIPAFVYFFTILYPMRHANNPRDPLASAAGGCVLLSREAWVRLGESFEPIKSEIIDDVNLARQVKGRGLPIRLSLSRTEVVSLREYPQLADIWKMVRRTAFTELKYSWLRVVGAMAGLALMFVMPIVAILAGTLGFVLGAPPILAGWAIAKGCIALAIMGHVYAPAMRFFKLPVLFAFSLPIAGILYGLMTFDSALRHARGLGVQWRDAGSKST